MSVALATASADLEGRVHAAAHGALRAMPAARTDASHLLEELRRDPATEVVVLDTSLVATGDALELAARLDRQLPAISVVLVSDRASEIGLDAMRSGVRDIIDPAAATLDIEAVLERAGRAARARAATQPAATPTPSPAAPAAPAGRIISVLSPKGGVGKTTVATNLAVGLAQAEPHSTVLVDLDVQFGDVASALNLQPEHSLPEAVHGPASNDSMVLKTYLSLHQTGLYVLCGADSPAAADSVTGDDVTRLLRRLAAEFRHVVVDTAPGLSEHTLGALDVTTDPVLLTSMDVPGVRGLRKELDTLDQLGMFPSGRQVVLNFADIRGGLTLADVEATIGTSVDLSLPRSKAVPASVNRGVPLLQTSGRDPMTKQLRRLVERFGDATTRTTGRRRGRHLGGAR